MEALTHHVTFAIGFAVALGAALIIGQAIYNVTFHPLSKYPGPKLWAAFHWPYLMTNFGGNQEKTMHELHEKYGQVVRIRPDGLSFTDSRAWKDVYGSRPGKGQMQKSRRVFKGKGDKLGELPLNLLVADDDTHARQRRLLAHAFSDTALRSQEDILTHYFQLLVSKLREQVVGPNRGKVNMVSWYNYTTFDIIGDLSFGAPFGALEAGTYHPWISNMFKFITSARWMVIANEFPIVSRWFNIVTKFVPEVKTSRDTHFDFSNKQVQQRLNVETDRKDFIDYVLRHNDEKGMSQGEILSNASVLVVAGSETTATLLSGVTYHLLNNPDKMARLQAEVRSAFDSVDEMTLVTVNKLPYLHAAIEEGLRMYPPVPGMLSRRTPAEGAIVAGEYIPGDTEVGVHNVSTYRDDHNFVEPYVFAPERFLPDAPAKYANEKKEALQPFSYGPRNCIGKNLAYNEMRSILARVVFEFDMKLCPESENWADQKISFLWLKRPLMVELSLAQKSA